MTTEIPDSWRGVFPSAAQMGRCVSILSVVVCGGGKRLAAGQSLYHRAYVLTVFNNVSKQGKIAGIEAASFLSALI